MTGLALAYPWFAVAGVIASLAMVAAHFIVVRTGRPRPLPTARFAVRAAERAVVVERRPADLLLLAFRAAALLLAGLALARPILPVVQRETTELIIAHLAGAADTSEVLARAQAGDRVMVSRASSLTAPLIQALQEAAALGSRGHPVRLSVISALSGSSVDSATLQVRGLWPGRIGVERVARLENPVGGATLRFVGEQDDPLRFGLALLPAVSKARDTAMVKRGDLAAADSVAARRGHAVVHWPAKGGSGLHARMERADTARGLTTGSYTFVAEFLRTVRLREPQTADTASSVVVRWADGAPAAIETKLGDGCVRYVGFDPPDAGDLVISRGFQRVVRALVAPCAALGAGTPPDDATVAALAGEGPVEVILRPAFATAAPFFPPALLVAAMILLLIEQLLRRRRA